MVDENFRSFHFSFFKILTNVLSHLKGINDREKRKKEYAELINALPKLHKRLFHFLFRYLRRFIRQSESHKMNSMNLGKLSFFMFLFFIKKKKKKRKIKDKRLFINSLKATVFAPNLLQPEPSEATPERLMQDSKKQISVIQSLIDNYEHLFMVC
jgi:hypothetical protein